MTDWQGAHNRDDHLTYGGRASCTICGQWCYAESPCWCCEEVTLGDCTAGDLWARVHAARRAELVTLRQLLRAQSRLAVLVTVASAVCVFEAFIADGWGTVGYAAMAGLCAYWAWLDWDAVRIYVRALTALEAHDE